MMNSPHMELTATENLAVPNRVNRPKKKAQSQLIAYRFMIFYRFMLAALGGYALASFAAMAIAKYFSDYQSSAAMSATLIGFLLQTGAFIWVFMVNKTLKATLGILIPTLLFYIAYHFLGK
ncbi:hypothetical protein IHE35_10195 [Acinetobacter sp. ASP199]|nr:hypothetical protein IHE35_10195 [Acinetobacter sp. ASP199]